MKDPVTPYATTGRPVARGRRLRFFAVIGGATLISLFFTLQNAVRHWMYGAPIELGWSLGTELYYWYLLAAALPLVPPLARRFRIERSTWARTLPVHVCLALLIGSVHAFVYNATLEALPSAREPSVVGAPWGDVLRRLPAETLTVFWKYAVAVGLFYAWDYYRKYQERRVRAAHLERRLSEARLEALRRQLHPHFLFNTLHTASMLTEEDPDAASRVLSRLADLLRATLEEGVEHEVPLATELSFVRGYLEIEQVRFGDRLSVEWDVPDALLDVRVPTLLLQPLVENAVRHGVSRRPGARLVGIATRKEHGTLVLEVSDDGPGLPEGWTPRAHDGVGLSNTRDRLETLYGEAADLALRDSPAGGVRAIVRLPLHRVDEVPGDREGAMGGDHP